MNKLQKGVCVILAIIVIAVIVVIAGMRIQDLKAKEEEKKVAKELGKEEPETQDYITVDGKKYEYNRDITTILFMGVDKKQEVQIQEYAGYGGQSDSIILFIMDKSTKKTQMLEISRNSMIELQIYDMNGEKLGKEKTPVVIHGGSGLSAETFTRLIELGGRKVNISTLVKNAYLDKTKELVLSGEKFAPIPFDTEVENAVKEEVKKHLEVFSGKRTSF